MEEFTRYAPILFLPSHNSFDPACHHSLTSAPSQFPSHRSSSGSQLQVASATRTRIIRTTSYRAYGTYMSHVLSNSTTFVQPSSTNTQLLHKPQLSRPIPRIHVFVVFPDPIPGVSAIRNDNAGKTHLINSSMYSF
jgi:hypothetical protein